MVYNWNWCGGMIGGRQRLFLTRQRQSYLFLIGCTSHGWQWNVAMFFCDAKSSRKILWLFSFQNKELDYVKMKETFSTLKKTRMHSSRMRTVRCSGRRGDVCLGAGVCLGGGCLPWGCLPRGVSALVHAWIPPPLMDRILDTRLWKHYLSATTL